MEEVRIAAGEKEGRIGDMTREDQERAMAPAEKAVRALQDALVRAVNRTLERAGAVQVMTMADLRARLSVKIEEPGDTICGRPLALLPPSRFPVLALARKEWQASANAELHDRYRVRTRALKLRTALRLDGATKANIEAVREFIAWDPLAQER